MQDTHTNIKTSLTCSVDDEIKWDSYVTTNQHSRHGVERLARMYDVSSKMQVDQWNDDWQV